MLRAPGWVTLMFVSGWPATSKERADVYALCLPKEARSGQCKNTLRTANSSSNELSVCSSFKSALTLGVALRFLSH